MAEKGGYNVDFINALDYRDEETAAVLGRVKRKDNGTGKFFGVFSLLPFLAEGGRGGLHATGFFPKFSGGKFQSPVPMLC